MDKDTPGFGIDFTSHKKSVSILLGGDYFIKVRQRLIPPRRGPRMLMAAGTALCGEHKKSLSISTGLI